MQKELPAIRPLSLIESRDPFDDPDWLFEIKYDGFRCLAYIMDNDCQLLSKDLSRFTGFENLRAEIISEVRARDAVLDGEIVSMDENGIINFENLVNGVGRISYFAFDLLILNGRSQRDVPLLERKRKLRQVITPGGTYLHYADYVAGNGKALYEMALKNDLEGIVAKPRDSRYTEGTVWYEIRNPGYSQNRSKEPSHRLHEKKSA